MNPKIHKKMKNYLHHSFSIDDFNLVSIIDDIPLWSAPFGLRLLDTIELKPNSKILDVGCGLGFPLVEIAQRLGNSCILFGVDPWGRALERVHLKLKTSQIKNAFPIKSVAEKLPFANNLFDLVVSNNGINNVDNLEQTLNECYRVSKSNAQFAVTLNLEETMIEFYNVFENVLKSNGLHDEIIKMKNHIYSKRKPLEEIKLLLTRAGFKVKTIYHDNFKMKFLNAKTMFNHSLIKYWFLDGWKSVVKPKDLEAIFEQIENTIDRIAITNGEFCLTIPFVTIDCRKN